MRKLLGKIKHNTLFGILIGVILLCSGIVYGTNSYQSNEVEYSPTNSSWEVSNVGDAIDSLYDMKNELETTKTSLNNLKSIGNAEASDIATGKTALVQGELITGTSTGMISKIAKDASGNDAAVHYYGARISSVTKSFNMNKGKYTLFVFSTYNDIYSSTATGGDTTNGTVVSGGEITKINDYCYIVNVESDNTPISVTIKSYGANEDRRTIYGIYFYE